ncbi:MAG: hypothetical protein WAV28_11065 [Sedimentisphaerales bacterium]
MTNLLYYRRYQLRPLHTPRHFLKTAYDIEGLESRMNELAVGLRAMQNELETL